MADTPFAKVQARARDLLAAAERRKPKPLTYDNQVLVDEIRKADAIGQEYARAALDRVREARGLAPVSRVRASVLPLPERRRVAT